MDVYQQFIHKSRYARWRDDLNRREHWDETAQRYVDFIKEHCAERNTPLPDDVLADIYNSIYNLEVMPSMRALMTAGKAAQKDFVSTYNCAYIPIDNIKSFDEILYVLACGTGIGFSVEEMYTSKLPEIPDILIKSDTTIVVPDSKIGWATSLRELVSLLYAGKIPNWDVSKVRPAGARLKTFGGRASGPAPLVSLFEFTVSLFRKAVGRKFTTLECHDLVCKIAECIIVGGVRRSALISLSDLSDQRMRTAKSGKWWEIDVQRALANNSAVYNSKPEIGQFLSEWKSLYESKSGERGFFNRDFANKHAKKFGRREYEGIDFGGNPSLRKGTKVWTTEGVFNIEDLEGKTFFVKNLNGVISPAKCWLSGKNKQLVKIKLRGGHDYYATKEHKWPVVSKNGSVTKKTSIELRKGDYLPTGKVEKLTSGVEGSYSDGFVIGWNLGDGWITERKDTGKKQIGFIVNNEDRNVAKIINDYLKTECSYSGDFINKSEINVNNKNLVAIFDKFQVKHKSNGLPVSVWTYASEDFRKGLINGLFSSDGHIETGSQRVTLSSAHEKLIRDISELLGFYGIKSSVVSRISQSYAVGSKTYTKTTYSYELKIGDSVSIDTFKSLFKLSSNKKQTTLENYSLKNKNSLDRILISSVEETDLYEDVWDIQVEDDTHCFQLAHCITGNCNEIFLRPYQFCNLTNVILRPEDDIDVVKRKVEIATIIGTIQSSFTDFRYLRSVWKKNCEEERLLGVGMSAIMDNPMMNAWKGYSKSIIENYTKGKTTTLTETLDLLREHAVEVNKKWADHLEINQSTAITCVKPDGNSSQLNKCSSGIHPTYSRYYTRTVRMAKTDPLSKVLIESGIPVEDDATNPTTGYVFSFPIESPKHSVLRNEVTAIDQLELYKVYQNHYTEHKPSITVYVRENEWIDVAAWVYKNFDSLGGVSFLPHSDHTYRQAPYQELTKEEYQEFYNKFPKSINWDLLSEYEAEDLTENTHALACVSGVCEL